MITGEKDYAIQRSSELAIRLDPDDPLDALLIKYREDVLSDYLEDVPSDQLPKSPTAAEQKQLVNGVRHGDLESVQQF